MTDTNVRAGYIPDDYHLYEALIDIHDLTHKG